MIQMHTARAEERSAVYALWGQVFGDDEKMLDDFFHLLARYEDSFVLTEGGTLRSILCAPEMTLRFPNGRALKSGYMYALATDPKVRGKGYGRDTMLYGASCLKNWGADCAILVPAEPSLFRFFDGLGYAPAFYHIRQERKREDIPAPPAGADAAPARPEEYNAIRRRWLAGRLYADCSDKLVTFQQHLAQACGGDIYRLSLPGGEGCAVVEPDGAQVVVKELLCAEKDLDLALAALAARHPAERYALRLPPWTEQPGQRVTWGAVLWLFDRPSPWYSQDDLGYLGLAFD
jgi:GNAT superfamily N-acetyltransferase